MSRLTRDGTAEPVSREQILRRERGQGSIHLSSSADHEQDWQPYPVDPYSASCGSAYIHWTKAWYLGGDLRRRVVAANDGCTLRSSIGNGWPNSMFEGESISR